MIKLRTSAIGCCCLLPALLAFAAPAAADDYPSRSIRLIIPFAPGGSNDVVGRIIANQLGEKLGKQVFVDNRPGAGGVVGSDLAAKADPDGHTLLIISVAHAVDPWLYKEPFDPAKSFAPVSIIATGTNVLTVNPGVPVHSVKELLDLAKEKPGVLNYASAGIGSFQHLSGELFKLMAGVNIQHVPYKGGGPAMLAVIAGEDQVMFSSIVQTVPNIQSGQLRALATGGAERTRSCRPADHRQIRSARLCGDQLVGHRCAGRHTAADRRQTARHHRRPSGFRGDQKIPRQRGRGASAHERGRVRKIHRIRNRQVGPGRQTGRHEGGVKILSLPAEILKRRDFIMLLGSAAGAWPLAARAQQPSMPVIGFVRSASNADAPNLVDAFRQGLKDGGFIDGQNVAIEIHSAEGREDQLLALVQDLIHRPVAVLVGNTPAALAAKVATKVVPIVFATGLEPVKVDCYKPQPARRQRYRCGFFRRRVGGKATGTTAPSRAERHSYRFARQSG